MSLSCERVIDRTAEEEHYLDEIIWKNTSNTIDEFINGINNERFEALEKDIQSILQAVNNLNLCVNTVLQKLECANIKPKKR